MLSAIIGFLQAFPGLVNLFDRAVTAYETSVKLQWAQSLQGGLHPLEQGVPTTDAEKLAAAKAVASAIAKMK